MIFRESHLNRTSIGSVCQAYVPLRYQFTKFSFVSQSTFYITLSAVVSYCSSLVAVHGDDEGTAVCYESRTKNLLGKVSNPASSFVHFTSSSTDRLRVLLESKVKPFTYLSITLVCVCVCVCVCGSGLHAFADFPLNLQHFI